MRTPIASTIPNGTEPIVLARKDFLAMEKLVQVNIEVLEILEIQRP
jgi:hypothetical protein